MQISQSTASSAGQERDLQKGSGSSFSRHMDQVCPVAVGSWMRKRKRERYFQNNERESSLCPPPAPLLSFILSPLPSLPAGPCHMPFSRPSLAST